MRVFMITMGENHGSVEYRQVCCQTLEIAREFVKKFIDDAPPMAFGAKFREYGDDWICNGYRLKITEHKILNVVPTDLSSFWSSGTDI